MEEEKQFSTIFMNDNYKAVSSKCSLIRPPGLKGYATPVNDIEYYKQPVDIMEHLCSALSHLVLYAYLVTSAKGYGSRLHNRFIG